MRGRVALALALLACAAGAQEPAAPPPTEPPSIEALTRDLEEARARIRALEADRERFAAQLLGENRLSTELQACRSDLVAAERAASDAGRAESGLRTDLRRAEDRARAAEQDARRARDAARRAESRARMCR
jgi:Skp family chaperone for outer membrane proteins